MSGPSSCPAVRARSAAGLMAGLSIGLLLSACSVQSPPASAPAAPPAPVAAPAPPPAPSVAPTAPPPAPIPVVALDMALLDAASKLFSAASTALGAPPTQRVLVIDPLVDAVSYTQSVTTRSMETKIQDLVRTKYPGFSVQPISRSSIGQAPIVLVGTFTAIDLKNQVGGLREAFRICLALADLKTGLIVAKGVARAGRRHRPNAAATSAGRADLGQGSGRRCLCANLPGDQARRSDRSRVSRRHPCRIADRRGRRDAGSRAIPGRGRDLPQRTQPAEGRTTACVQRHLQRELEARGVAPTPSRPSAKRCVSASPATGSE